MNHYNSDNPIKLKSEDKFNRYSFALRISDTIKHRNSSDSLVIGLYGKWGDGKTSALNFIEENLKKNQSLAIVKLNPWRFNTENDLIISFFKALAIAAEKSLNSKTYEIGKKIIAYAKGIVPSVSIGGVADLSFDNFDKTLDSLSDDLNQSIDTQKEKIEQILLESKKKIIIIVDDIDRLNRKEIQLIFKLIKLSADFKNTTYILAFDEEMVAKSIGELYGGGDDVAGKNFLEKIIQVPLRIPTIDNSDLKDYFLNSIDNVLKTSEYNIDEKTAYKIGNSLIEYFVDKIQTPREIVRYTNILSFTLPLLKGEANVHDIIVIEGIRCFYPQLYNFIKENPDYFIRSYERNSSYNYRDDEHLKRKEAFLKEFENITHKRDYEITKKLLRKLFPVLDYVFSNIIHNKKWEDLYQKKSIGSRDYFQRYFTYAVSKNDISDIEFDKSLEELEKGNFEEIKKFTNKQNIDKLFWKLHYKLSYLKINQKRNILNMILNNSIELTKDESDIFDFDSPFGKFKYLFKKILQEIISDKNSSIDYQEYIKNIITKSANLDFIINLVFDFNADYFHKEIESLQEDQLNNINILLLERVLKECGKEPIFIKFPRRSHFLLNIWIESYQSHLQLKKYLNNIFKNNPSLILDYILSYASIGIVYNLEGKKTYMGDLHKGTYNDIKKHYDVKKLAKYLTQNSLVDKNYTYVERDTNQNKESFLHQFYYHYLQDNPNEVSTIDI